MIDLFGTPARAAGRVSVPAALACVVLAVAVHGAFGAVHGPALLLNPVSGTAGTEVGARGHGFCAAAACSPVKITVAGVVVASNIRVSASGAINTIFRVPGGTAPGQLPVVASQTLANGSVATAYSYFTVTIRPSAPPLRLYATVTSGGIKLLTGTGAVPKRIKPGVYLVEVRDRTRTGNFHLYGPGFNHRTGIAFTGSLAWTAVLSANDVYRYRDDAHAGTTRSFRTTAGS